MTERPIQFNSAMVRGLLRGMKTQTRRVVDPKQPIPASLQRFEVRKDPIYGSWVLGPAGASLVSFMQMGHGWVTPAFGRCPFGYPGDRLWVREDAYIAPPHFGDRDLTNCTDTEGHRRLVGYVADMDGEACEMAEGYGVKKSSSTRMPRWASRLLLEVTSVRVERLQAISEADAVAEGVHNAGAVCGQNPDGSWRMGYSIDMPACQLGAFETARDGFRCLWDILNHKRGPNWEANPWVWVVEFKMLSPPSSQQEGPAGVAAPASP